MTRRTRRQAALVVAAAAALFSTACAGQDSDSEPDAADTAEGDGNGGDTGGGDEPVTIEWWHNSNNDPGRSYYEQVAADFEEANPNVTIEINAQEHEDMLTRLDAAFQSGDVPDIYMERGGGELAAHVDAGLTRDLTDDAAETIDKLGGSVAGWQVDDRTYALPFSLGVVGFWYNTALFEEAGITEPPQTLDDWLAAVDALKDADIEPVSVGAGDAWPAAHYWYYTALRQCAQDVLQDAVTSLGFSDPCFVRAGETLQTIVEAEPFNAGFLTTPAQEGPTSASGLLATERVAMELAGHWEPGVMQGLTEDGEGLGENTGWFPFPEVPGQEGDPEAVLGGGDAWALSADAPDQAVDFIEYLLSDEVQQGFAENDMGLPVNPAASDSVTDPALSGLLEVRDNAPYVQLYFDTAFGESVGGAMNDAIVQAFAGNASPQDIVDATQQAADAEQ
ncbi:extracellular solute-binding protein [Phytoactinopolyspora halotolerans]|uniref:Extracellular solute-binding protein n=1 Tax=Phytoactinopolyspora halotolerans TaxID=1981512 RepID=A0A6L9S9D0_9ACTN|nr:extracellular solute-binding protein [Phytoactinopolyspora halotolerans]NEE01118.1 extracellular solute-binding protein [Phytoactinopolyspora halotolerans]